VKIAVASDHAGFQYKEQIKQHLIELGHEVRDFGALTLVPDDDYPDYIRPAAEAVARGECERGIIFGGSGNGEAMVANRRRGVRAAVAWNLQSAELSRRHNDANVLSIGQRMVDFDTAVAMVDRWLATPFEGGRHAVRVRKIEGEEW